MKQNIIIKGDCIEEMKKLPENSVDSIVTDPPYGLGFMGKQWDTFDKTQFGKEGEEGENDLKVKKNFKILPRYNSDGLYDFTKSWAEECLRVVKPGGYILCFSGTRTYHKICMGIEDAGFDIRDMISWLYGSGFPKSLNIGKAVDKVQGNERKVIGNRKAHDIRGNALMEATVPEYKKEVSQIQIDITKGTSEWEGWGTALKPACEPIVVARKPLSEKNVALNCLKWGTGGINIDGCRVGFRNDEDEKESKNKTQHSKYPNSVVRNSAKNGIYHEDLREPTDYVATGRFPANIILDEEAGKMLGKPSRFFYCAKASKSERNLGLKKEEVIDCDRNPNCYSADVPFNRSSNPKKNNHPTVKPMKLMQYLVRLVTKKGGLVLDPFLGSGTTACACIKEGMNYIGIERDEDYCKIAEARIKGLEKE
jgi:DNA modification methylase